MRGVVLLVLAGCTAVGPREADTAWCTGEAMPSVDVQVVDLDGAPFVPSRVTWRVGSSAPLAATCVVSPCTRWTAGVEVVGAITVSAFHEGSVEGAPGCAWDARADGTVEVGLDETGCHVRTESLVLALESEAMTCEEDQRARRRALAPQLRPQ